MTDRPAQGPIAIAVAIVLVIAAIVAAKIGMDRYDDRYTVTRSDDGQAVSQVVRATFAKASGLKVGGLTGTVQSSASDTRGFGMLVSDRVIKAPFSVDYFVDVSRLGADDYRWDAKTRTLTVDAPDIVVGKVNVDEAGQTLAQTRGLFVTRAAAEALAQRVSQNATRTAQVEAVKPERIAAARATARAALRDLLGAPLAAAGLDDVRVTVTFPNERRAATERWDTSRSLGEVLGNTK